ncbi:MAG: hypothetical protein O2856_13355 [Planctomycetota bacterium]|nr:hypothetical protein [Planctomycetota bacterium]
MFRNQLNASWIAPAIAVIGLSAGLAGIAVQLPGMFPKVAIEDASMPMPEFSSVFRSFLEAGETLPMPTSAASVIPEGPSGNLSVNAHPRVTVVDVWDRRGAHSG